ncbi:MAG: response regulator transcription factor [Planctomycetaceae bacterium]|jgi:DNA-binding NarL/FixJ family response regulator|nr:response regulator transcription factor [Planctomycetaceae bacterium]
MYEFSSNSAVPAGATLEPPTTAESTTRVIARRRTADAPPSPSLARDASKAPVRVLCVDDHVVLVEGLKAQFGIDGQLRCVASLDSAEHAIDAVVEHRPDVVVFDIEMPGPDVFEIADRLHHLHPDVRFVFLSAHIRDGFLASAYRVGASGYFAKGDDLEEIVDGLKRVARCAEGTFVMGSKVRARCQQPKARGTRLAMPGQRSAAATGAPATLLDSLTQRELEVLRLIGKGMSRGEIGEELARSPKTVDGHQERILKKLRMETRAELMRFAIREGLAQA